MNTADIEIVGAAATVVSMCKLIETTTADIAILDVNLNGALIFPAVIPLIERNIPIVFMTGYAPERLFPPHLLKMPIFQKPYDPDEFLDQILKLLGQTKTLKDEPQQN